MKLTALRRYDWAGGDASAWIQHGVYPVLFLLVGTAVGLIAWPGPLHEADTLQNGLGQLNPTPRDQSNLR